MSEKRFKLDSGLYEIYDYDKLMTLKEVVELLNEQQSRIEVLEDNCLADTLTRKNLEGIIEELKKENEKLRQQNRKLYKCSLYGKTIGDEL